MSPPAGTIRFLTPSALVAAFGGYYGGDFEITYPALGAPPGDGSVHEWDIMVPVPGFTDGTVLGVYAYITPGLMPLGEWTFSTLAPPAGARWGSGLMPPGSDFSYWAAGGAGGDPLDAGVYDGGWTPYDLGFRFGVDTEGSAPGWWDNPPPITVDIMGRGDDNPRTYFLASSGRTWQDVHNDTGSGQLSAPNDAAGVPAIRYGDKVLFRRDGEIRFGGTVEQKNRTTVAPNEESDEVTVISGRGLAAWLEEAVVGPQGGAGGGQVAQTRAFNFAHPALDMSGWSDVLVAAPRAKPEGWPDPDTEWVWSQDPNTLPVPGGDVYFRRNFWIPPGTMIEAWAAADDGYELWIDGQKQFDDTLDAAWTGIAKKQQFVIGNGEAHAFDPNWHVLAIHARNNNALLAGLFACVVTKDASDTVTSVLCRTHGGSSAGDFDGWKILAYPAQAPGFSAGRVVRMLVEEAKARGGLPHLGIYNTWDPYGINDYDWRGTPWPIHSDISVQVGQDLLSVVKQLADAGYLDFDIDVTNLWTPGAEMRFFVPTLPVSAVSIQPGVNATELTHDGRA